MIQLALRSIIDCIHSFLSSTSTSLIFLLIYGAMWKFDIHFDTRFFAIAYNLLIHTEVFVMGWFTEAIRNLAKYMAAEKRIQVCFKMFLNYSIEMKGIFLQAFLLLEESQRDRRLSSVSEQEIIADGHQTINEMKKEEKHIERISIKKLSKVECNLQRAYWQQVKIFSISLYFLLLFVFT
jgi:hypothetical protein